MTFEVIQKIVGESIGELFTRDQFLIQNDVSERAITHKLAEYLQKRIPHLHVDCEYNRNATEGHCKPKQIEMLKDGTRKIIADAINGNNWESGEETDWTTVSTYPDIIAHRRMTNDFNLLIVEVKKRNSKIASTHDHNKLMAFTENTQQNSYSFQYGVFIVVGTEDQSIRSEMTWFRNGNKLANNQ